MDKKTRQLIINGIYSSGSWIINILVTILAVPYFIYKLASDGYGVFMVVNSLIGYYGLAGMSMSHGIVKYVPEYYADNNNKELSKLINTTLVFQAGVAVLSIIVTFIFSDLIVGIFNVGDYFEEAVKGVKICSVGFAMRMLLNSLLGVLRGLQRYDITAKIFATRKTFRNVSIAVALWLGYGLVTSWALVAISIIGTFIISFIVARNTLKGWCLSWGLSYKHLKKVLSFGALVSLNKTSSMFNDYIPRIFLSHFLGPSSVSFFTVSRKVVQAADGFISKGFQAAFPYSSEMNALGDEKKLKKLFWKGTKILAFLFVPCFLVLFLISRPVLSLWVGGEFASNAWPVLAILSLLSMASGATKLVHTMASGIGYMKEKCISSVIMSFIHISMFPILTKFYGMYGALVSIVFPTIIVRYAFMVYMSVKVFGKTISSMFEEIFTVYIPSVILIVPAGVLLNMHSYGVLVGLIIGLSIGALNLAVLSYLQKEFCQEVFKGIRTIMVA